MQVSLVLTLLGPDRSGIVRRLADLVAGHDGNWLESRMCRLGGEFAGILRCQLPAEQQAALETALEEFTREGFAVVVKPDPGHTVPEGSVALLDLVGQDRPGIVRQVSTALARHGVNVEELDTECVSAPMSGETLFRANIRVWIPANCDQAALRADIERIAADLLVEVTLAAAETG
ncbi:MAG: ACT domain-containing protein [Verrucomicrobiales bacterium]|nr:ACT domain-containing protein [Verrucomicrobiales bacterium]